MNFFFHVGKNSIFLVTSLLGMAKVLGSIGRATRAIEFYHRVITIFELNRGAESVDLVLPLSGLGNQLIKEGKATDAENVFTRLVASLFFWCIFWLVQNLDFIIDLFIHFPK